MDSYELSKSGDMKKTAGAVLQRRFRELNLRGLLFVLECELNHMSNAELFPIILNP